MRLERTLNTGWLGWNHRGSQRGFTVLLVLVFVFIIELLILSNTHTLDELKRELKLIEKRQQAKFAPAVATSTNHPPARIQALGPRP